jgi:dihydrofolate reductase
MRPFDIVVAVDSRHGIGKNGALPWQLPGDMAFFRKLTTGIHAPGKRNAVVMGRKTWESIPPRFRPLKDRLNVVITRQPSLTVPSGVIVAESLDDALSAADREDIEGVFLIGGGAVYTEAVGHPSLQRIYWTEVRADFGCDTFFPRLSEDFVHMRQQDSEVLCENGIEYVFTVYERKTADIDHSSVLTPESR